jgi:hypothetical protein
MRVPLLGALTEIWSPSIWAFVGGDVVPGVEDVVGDEADGGEQRQHQDDREPDPGGPLQLAPARRRRRRPAAVVRRHRVRQRILDHDRSLPLGPLDTTVGENAGRWRRSVVDPARTVTGRRGSRPPGPRTPAWKVTGRCSPMAPTTMTVLSLPSRRTAALGTLSTSGG